MLFAALKPDTFLTAFTFRSMANSRSINALAALAVMIPLAANHFDLSVASVIGIAQVLANGLQTQQHLPWQLAVLLVLLLGAVVGLINGVLVTRFRISSFIATLGTGTVLLGLNQWYTGGRAGRGPARPGVPQALDHRAGPRRALAPALRAGHRRGALARLRLPAARPLSLRHRRQSRAPPRWSASAATVT